MSQPEIFRRCSSCGASCRTGELFCAQCGNALAPQTITPSATPVEQNAGDAEHDLAAKTKAGQEMSGAEETVRLPTPGLQANQPVPEPDDSQPGAVTATNNPIASTVIGHPRPDSSHDSSHDPRMKSQRHRSAALGAMEARMKPGVDKLRRVSSVVLDEAAYDPSIRFILVVGVLFVLFVVLLLLSKWIG